MSKSASCTCPGRFCRAEICSGCGHKVHIGEWYLCPHGKPHGMLGVFKPYTQTNCGDRPIDITSWKEHQNLFKAHWRDDKLIQYVERDGQKIGPGSGTKEAREAANRKTPKFGDLLRKEGAR
jgi:hypothetical protein